MAKIRCPRCKSLNTISTDGARIRQGDGKYRRLKKCNDCGYKFTTIEEYVPNPILYSRKKDNNKERRINYKVIAFAERVKEQLDASIDELDMYNQNNGLLYAIEIVDRELENDGII